MNRYVKRFLVVLTLAALALGAAMAEGSALPAAGDTLSGFVVKEVMPVEVLGATGVVFEHQKSGATLLYLASDDTNRSFDITFQTPALDNKGKPHVFEHMTICGSQKYPDANLFFPVANQTYSTFVNAVTYHGMTSYPVASLSEEQLMTMMDYYLSGVFTPLLYTEPQLVQREAWRYELTAPDQPLNIAGTVYSEMQGALTVGQQAASNYLYTLFDGSPVAYESGGLPEAIRTLTYDELVAFHDEYYHPSNALITLYGKLDYEKFLTFIDQEYLSKYDKRDVYVEKGVIEPYTETRYATYAAPVEKGAPTDNVSFISYSYGMDGIDPYDLLGVQVLLGVLREESSPLMRALREKLPSASLQIKSDCDTPVPYVEFLLSGVNESDRDTFIGLVDEALAQYAAEGVPADELESQLAVQKLSLMLTPEDSDLGVNASLNLSLFWTYFDRLDYYTVYERVLNEATPALMDRLLRERFTDNAYRAVAVTIPTPGLAEDNAAALSAELEKKKAAMSENELSELAASSQAFIDWSAQPADTDVIAPILNMTVDKLPEETLAYKTEETVKDGVRYLTAAAEVGDVGSTVVLLDGSTLPIEQLQDVELYLCLLGEVDTDQHTKETLSPMMTRYLSGFSSGLTTAAGYKDAGDRYSASLSWIGLSSDYAASVALLKELFTQSQLTDIADIRGVLARMQTAGQTAMDDGALSIQFNRCAAAFRDCYAYRNYIADIEWYRYVTAMIALADSDPQALTQRLESAKALINNKQGAQVLFAGNPASIQTCLSELLAFFNGMAAESRAKVDYSPLRTAFKREALINNTTVHMNVVMGPAQEYTGKLYVASNLIGDVYLLPLLRNAMGAYGAYCSFGATTNTLYTYRDPNLQNTFEVFEALPEYLRTMAVEQADVDRYIVGSYTGLARPEGKLSGALTALTRLLDGYPEDYKLKLMREAKQTTVEDVRSTAQVVEEMLQNGVYSSSGSQSLMDESAELFDSQVKLEEETAQDDAA